MWTVASYEPLLRGHMTYLYPIQGDRTGETHVMLPDEPQLRLSELWLWGRTFVFPPLCGDRGHITII